MKCRICGNADGNQVFVAKEMMLGTREGFEYFECSFCGCLQICSIPERMPKYYPAEYFSVKSRHIKLSIKGILKHVMVKSNRFLPRRVFSRRILSVFEQSFVQNLVRDFNFDYNSRILEVGCGRGDLMELLLNLGFKNVLGLEPFARGKNREDLRIFNSTVEEYLPETEFDVVIFNHSLEHIPGQLSTFSKISKLLSDKGICQVRIPIKTDYVWRHFGINWVQLDAPRHFYLHTLKSFRLLADMAGLSIKNMIFDSTEFLFWGSEQYLRNIPMRTKNSYEISPEESYFTKKQIKNFGRMAKKLNVKNQGDQGTFYLAKTKEAKSN